MYATHAGERPEFRIGFAHAKAVGLERLRGEYWTPRLICIGFSILAIAVFYKFLWKPICPGAAVIAIAYWCFSPEILAHGPTIGPDVGAVALGLLAFYFGWQFVHYQGLKTATAAGVVFGFALLTKLTWLTAFISLPGAVFLCVILLGRQLPASALRSHMIHFLLFAGSALFILNAGYAFEDSFKPLGEYEFCSELLGGEGCNDRVHGNRFKDEWLASVPVPVPRNYLLGIDYLKYEVEAKKWSFLDGEWKFGSWPCYYVMTTLYKTPESTLLGALIGLGVLITGIRRKMVKPEVMSMFLFLGVPAGVCFASVSLQGGFNHHHRYVLMIYPCMFALAAYIASPVGVVLLRLRLPFLGQEKRSIAVPLAVTLVILSAASSLRVHPYYTSYFNTLSGGPDNGWHLLGFSNIDWGQDILEVDKWLKENAEKRPLAMDLDHYDMNADMFGVSSNYPPRLPKDATIDEVRKAITETQWWIISVKNLYNLPGYDGLEYLQQIEPDEKIAYAYHVYRIDPLPSKGDDEEVATGFAVRRSDRSNDSR